MEALFALFGVIGILAAATVLKGYVLATLWGWFVIPAFGVPPIPVAIACGLALVVSLFTSSVPKKDDDPVEAFTRAAISALTFPFFCLGLGRIIVAFT